MEIESLKTKIDGFIKDNERNIVNDIAALVAVKSVEEAPAPGAPFGEGPRKALDKALEIAEGMGLATNAGDGYVGWAQLDGTENGHIAAITHMDVVPEGEGWDADPFTLREKDGWLLGRGVGDDKGPAVLSLYAAKFFKQQGIPLRYGLRTLFGCNEESGMGDVAYYLENNESPLFCFSPDADFPVCNGEKGQFGGSFVSAPISGGNIVQFSCGLAFNVIPGRAECVAKANAADLKETSGVKVRDNGGGTVRIEAEGVGGHSAHPDGTVNALGVLVAYLLKNNLCAPQEKEYFELLNKMLSSPYGEGLGIDCEDEMFGRLTINGGVISFENGVFTQSIDIRYPTATSGEKLEKALANLAQKHGATLAEASDEAPFYIPADCPTIKALLSAYEEGTGKKGKAFTMGGGTYARHFENAVSYGPAAEGEELPPFAGPAHGANEGASLQSLLTALKVYIIAIARLQELDL